MRSSKRSLVTFNTSAQQPADHSIDTELTIAWKTLAQSKAALRHIENHLEAGPGTAVLDSVMDPPKKKSSRTVACWDGQNDDTGGSSKYRAQSHPNSKKESSRSPLRNATQDSNVRKNNSVEFRDPLASYREASPLPHPSSQLVANNLQTVPGSICLSTSPPSDPQLAQLVYQRGTKDKQTDRDLDSTYSSALLNSEIHYLNDQSALDSPETAVKQSHPTSVGVSVRRGAKDDRTPKAQFNQTMDCQDSTPCVVAAQCSIRRGDNTPSSSPGSASQRLENLRRHQPDDKLEKLKERIRRQRQHLEEAAQKEKLLGNLEKPIMTAASTNNGGTNHMPTAKVRKVAAAPPAPIYKGFNCIETKIRIPDGKVLKEEDFPSFSRELYSDLARQFTEGTTTKAQKGERSKDRRSTKTVRKIHRAATTSEMNSKPVISPASWREGQKLVKSILGPVPKLPSDDRLRPADRRNRQASRHHSSTESPLKSNQQSRPKSKERSQSARRGESKSGSTAASTPSSAAQDKDQAGVSTKILSADIRGILDDLQLECKADEKEERARQRSRRGSGGRRGRGASVSRTRTPVSAWGTSPATVCSSRGCRSASPSTRISDSANVANTGQKTRHYDVDTVREYITRQQEERKRRQAEEKRALREETDKKNQRLQDLYRKQREAAKTVSLPCESPVAPVQKRLQETYNQLLLEEAQLSNETTQTQPAASSRMRPMYQPSGESDKENRRLEPPQSPSSSDRSLNDQPTPPLPRNDMDFGVVSFIQPDCLNPAAWPPTGPSNSVHLLSQLLRLDTSVATGNVKHTEQQASTPSNMSQSKMSRIEAIKAAASSLSNRLENEARKLAGERINYGAPTSINMDTIVAPQPSQAIVDDGCWTRTQAEDTTENNDMTLRIQRILTSMGHSSLNDTALPGTGTFHINRGQKEKNSTQMKLANATTAFAEIPGHTPNSSTKEKRRLVSGFERIDKVLPQRGIVAAEENQSDIHDTSAGSLSEGPLLSEGSLSEDETSDCVPRPRDCLEAGDYCAGQRRDYQGLCEFQEAAKCSNFSSTFAQQDTSKAPWEELNKGSPLSVINIFTKNLQSQVKASERNSPAHSLNSGICPEDAVVYEEDFISSHSSGASGQLKRSSNLHSGNSHFEELMRRSPYEKPAGLSSHHSSFHSSAHSPHVSSGSTSGSSPQSRYSAKKIGNVSDQSGATLIEDEMSSLSMPPKELSSDSRRKSSDTRTASSHSKNSQCTDTLPSGLFHQSLGLDGKKSPATRHRLASPSGFPDPSSPSGPDGPSEPLRGGSLVDQNFMHAGTSVHNCREEAIATGELQYSPAVLQQRMAVELHYLESIEESVRQLGDVERLMGVSMAQHESASLAQMLKAKQQRHEHDLYELKIKAEREALEAKLQLEENRQRMARAQIELQESLAVTQKETLESLQDATTKLMSQQAEAARYTANAARHIKEMTELAQSQITGALAVPTSVTSQHQREEKRSSFAKQQQDKSDSDSFQTEGSSRGIRTNEPESSLNSVSHSDSIPFIRSSLSGADSGSQHNPSCTSGDQKEQGKKEAAELKWRKGGGEQNMKGEAGNMSIEEELPTAFNDSICSDSIPSVVDDKGESTSVITEYSLKFDESMTEDEIEERSFRSLLPSEAHRRETMEKRPRHHEEPENSGPQLDKIMASGAQNILKNGSIAFSSGQDSFSQFTMEMVRQYMKDEEVRLQHQSSLLGLRQKALKEKIRTEVEWLEHQKKHLRDKGEDDKMPPIRKKQRGLLMRLQQEQAEIKRLQEANKAARKERQLLLKQQEEIERMRTSTLRLKERLKCAGCEVSSEPPMLELPVSETASPCMRHNDDIRTPSPSPSISGSETSSIMQKLKKMRSQMDEKFLTKREQQLMQRRRHAEELLQWKQRLDKEEAEVRRIEKEALAQWDRDMSESQKKEISDISPISSHLQISEPRTDSEKDYISEGDCSPATPGSSIHTEVQPSQQAQSASVSEPTLASVHSSPANYIQDFTSVSASASRQSSPFKDSPVPASPLADGSNKTKMQPHASSQIANQAPNQLTDTTVVTQSEPISDQSDIESRIKALKEELRKRKFMAYQLKKEQKKRHKERLKAQEASLLKQLQNFNTYIEKTKAELNKESELVPDTKSFNKDSSSDAEESRIKSPARRFETHKICDSGKTQIDSSTEQGTTSLPEHVRSTSSTEKLSEEDTPPVTPTPLYSSPEGPASGLKSLQSRPSSERALSQMNEFVDEKIVSDQISCIQEELDVVNSDMFEDQKSGCLLQLETEDHIESQEKLFTSKDVSQSTGKEQPHLSLDQDRQLKTRDSSEEEESQSTNIISKLHCSKMDLKTSQHPSHSFSNHSCSPHSDASLSTQEKPLKDVKASSLSADDFESSRERHHSSKTSQISDSPCEIEKSTRECPGRVTQVDSQDEEVEEEINEELSDHSDPSKDSHESVGLLDLRRQTDDSEHDSKNIHSRHSPPISPIRTPLSPVIDEMPGFNIGDRVLVGGVQPGTLRFKGQTRFANGFWAGVELDKPEGSNNGTYDGVAYFNCDECHGIFAPPDKVTHLPDKFEVYADTTEDEDSFLDDFSGKGDHKCKKDKDKGPKQESHKNKPEETSQSFGFGNKNVTTKSGDQNHDSSNRDTPKNDKICLILEDHQQSKYPFSNDNSRDIILDFENSSTPLFTNDKERITLGKDSKRAVPTLIEREDMCAPRPCTPADISKEDQKERLILNTFADELLNNFVKDTVKQFAQIKKVKEQKIEASNQMNGELFENDVKELISSVEQGDGLPFFQPTEKEELSSPELCNRPESPVLGASGQEELAKRLAELELSRELLDELGDDQDWFDEDFGLSSRREQQRLKQKQREEEEKAKQGGELERTGSPASEALGRLLSSPDGEQQVKTSPKPAVPLPLPPKLPELPAMVVPHSAIEVEKMVHAAVLEIWDSCGMAKEGTPTLTELHCPTPSQAFLSEKAGTQDQEALCIRSYRKAVYDLTWEILQEIYAEDPNVDQPQWIKPRRVISSFFHRVKASGDITKIQEFITAEVLKLYGLAKDQSQKTDWQKMLKFGRKKRDRVDHILVQELHEEEVQWVSYDEDELFVKMQLAESIFDTLLKDTVNILSVISEKNDKRGDMS